MEVEINNECWPRTIIFNMRELPIWACSLDQLIYPKELSLNEDERDWFWRFPICVGKTHYDSSHKIIRIVNKAYSDLSSMPECALKIISKHLIKYAQPEAVFNSWLETLQTINELAKFCDECSWFSPIYIGEDIYYVNLAEEARRTLRVLDSMIEDIDESGGVSENVGPDKKDSNEIKESEE